MGPPLSTVAGNQFSLDAGGNATLSDLQTRTMTPDQMNTEALLQSRDYLQRSDLGGSTGYSDQVASGENFNGGYGGGGTLRSTFTLQRTGESIPETLTERSTADEMGDSAGASQRYRSASGGKVQTNLQATFDASRPSIIKIPTSNEADEGNYDSDAEISEVSI
jgi:hypothetical protein